MPVTQLKYGHDPHQGLKPSTTVLTGRPAVNYSSAVTIFKCPLSLIIKHLDICVYGPSRLGCMLMTVQWIFNQGCVSYIARLLG
jgi:hypothetical protein